MTILLVNVPGVMLRTSTKSEQKGNKKTRTRMTWQHDIRPRPRSRANEDRGEENMKTETTGDSFRGDAAAVRVWRYGAGGKKGKTLVAAGTTSLRLLPLDKGLGFQQQVGEISPPFSHIQPQVKQLSAPSLSALRLTTVKPRLCSGGGLGKHCPPQKKRQGIKQ